MTRAPRRYPARARPVPAALALALAAPLAAGASPAAGPAPATVAREMVEVVVERCAIQMMQGRHPDTAGLAAVGERRFESGSGAVALALDDRAGARVCAVSQTPGSAAPAVAARVFDAVGRWATAAIAEERAFLVDDCPEGGIARKLHVASEAPVRRGRHLALLLVARTGSEAVQAVIGEVEDRPEPVCFEEVT